MVHGAFGVCADAAEFALLAAFSDDCLGGEFARFVLRPIPLLLIAWFVVANLNVLVAGNCGAALLLRSVRCADLYQLRFGCYGLADVRFDLRGIAFRIGALCGIWANCKSFLLARRRRVDRVRP